MRFVSSKISKFNHCIHRILVFFLPFRYESGRSNEVILFLFLPSTADDEVRLWEIAEENDLMKRLLPSSFELVNTQYRSALK